VKLSTQLGRKLEPAKNLGGPWPIQPPAIIATGFSHAIYWHACDMWVPFYCYVADSTRSVVS